MAGVDCLIFSKDRPAQLDLLLRSVERYAPDLYRSLTVLHTWSAQPFMVGYSRCRELHPFTRFVVDATSFAAQVRSWVTTSCDYISFLVDDDVFYRQAPSPAKAEQAIPLSLRGGDYDYPFSLDGNIYRRDDILALLDGLTFTSPTSLEHQGHLHRDRLPFQEVHGWRPPCLVGLPLNRVSADSLMPHMGVHEYDLNELFLQGGRLALFEGDREYGPHEAILPDWTTGRVAV